MMAKAEQTNWSKSNMSPARAIRHIAVIILKKRFSVQRTKAHRGCYEILDKHALLLDKRQCVGLFTYIYCLLIFQVQLQTMF